MTDFLVKRFIKEHQNTESPIVRAAFGVLSSIVGICCNVLLFIVKFVTGLLINSVSVIADAFNNLSDAASSIIGLVGARIAARPGDKDHPFGHGRAEYIAALLVAFVILEVGLSCIRSSVGKIFSPEAINFSYISIGILVLSMLVKLWLAFFNRKLAGRINSSMIKATATDSLNDVMVTGATVISIIVFKLFKVNLDGYMGTIVAILVLISGINIIRSTVTPLLGEAADKEVCDRIVQKVMSYDGIMGTHDLIVHSYGPSRSMATIHAEVASDADILEAHETIDRIERDVFHELGVFLVIHMDPIEVRDELVIQKKGWLCGIINELDPKITIHDFRMVSGGEKINLIFDIVVPLDYSESDCKRLSESIKTSVSQKDSRCQCVITVDRSFVG